MIDIQLLRKDIDAVAARLAQRKFQLDVAGFNALEAERKSIQTRTEELQGQRNSLSKQIGILKGKGEDSTAVMNQVASIADELKASADRLEIIQNKLSDFMLAIPNLPHESVPAGHDETGNVELRKVGSPKQFDFEVKELRNKLLFEHKIFTGFSGTKIIRLLPPLSLKVAEADCFIDALKDELGKI